MTVLQALNRYYQRLEKRNEVATPGYSWEPISAVVVVSATGRVLDIEARKDSSGKRPQQRLVPKWFGRSGNGSTPFFLWENTAYALGVSNKEPGKTARDHAAFRQLHLEALASVDDEGLQALRLFVEQWTPDQFAGLPFDSKTIDANLAFRLDGEMGLIHERSASRVLVERLRNEHEEYQEGECLITGSIGPIVRLHPKIKGVRGTASAEVPLASFEGQAFRSYNKDQGYNAPTSTEAAFRYGAALNSLWQLLGETGLKIKSVTRRSCSGLTPLAWPSLSGRQRQRRLRIGSARSPIRPP